MKDTFVCPEGTSGRADKVLADHYSEFSRSFIKQSIMNGGITRPDGSIIEPKTKIGTGDTLLVRLVFTNPDSLEPYRCELSILHEDEDLIVINKKAGMVVHPGDGTDNKTLVHALLHHCPDNLSMIGAPLRPGIVHRLDKDTSGVMVVAKSNSAHLCLTDQFANRKTRKVYQAIVCGELAGVGEFQHPIGRHPVIRVKMGVSEKGKPAWTKWKKIKNFQNQFTLVECEIMTGRTHQIRVHFSNAKHPLAGDKTYGYKLRHEQPLFPRVMLHAWKLFFEHPLSKKKMAFEAPLPNDFKLCLKKLEV
ncbi:MAG: RluA family pseudouridine synthase [Opitutae bacterium]